MKLATALDRLLSMTNRDQDQEEADRAPQETASFPFDRMTIARFRETFPKARWSDRLQAWTVPGKTARKRINRWLASEAARRRPYEEERGRDAFEFEPILSPYLEVYDGGFRVNTPYSKRVIEELHQVPFARWSGNDKVWEIPFASYEDLQLRWETIEEAAKWAEPRERQKRANARRGTEEEAKSKRRVAERKRGRLPVASDELPPLGRPVSTLAYGIVVITEVTGELIDPKDIVEFYPTANADHVWASWRASTFDELVNTWPAVSDPGESGRSRGWWTPTLDGLRDARKTARIRARRKTESAGLVSAETRRALRSGG